MEDRKGERDEPDDHGLALQRRFAAARVARVAVEGVREGGELDGALHDQEQLVRVLEREHQVGEDTRPERVRHLVGHFDDCAEGQPGDHHVQ